MGTGAKDSSTPSWITSDYIQQILRTYFKDETITVEEFSGTIATSKGDSYASILYRVLIQFTRNEQQDKENLSLIFKVHPTGLAGRILKKNRLFDREIFVYTEIMPKIQDLLESVNDFTKISPECLHHATESPETMLVFEDLKSQEFVMYQRGRMLNLNHALLVIQKIAKFHACSAVVHQGNPKMMDLFIEGQISANPERQDFLGFFPANMKSLAEESATWVGYEEIAQKLFALEETILSKGVELFTDPSNMFKVLNQDDMWINNIMFRYNPDDGEPNEALVIDYQLAYFGSPGIDLNYFLYGSVNENIRKVHFKFLIREYHRILKETLERLNFKGQIPTLKDIHIELIRKGLHAVIAAVCLAPLIFMEPTKTTELEGLFDRSKRGQDLRRSNIQNPRYKTYIMKLLKEFELSGFLD